MKRLNILISFMVLQAVFGGYILWKDGLNLGDYCLYFEGNRDGKKVVIEKLSKYENIKNLHYVFNGNKVYVCNKDKNEINFYQIINEINEIKNQQLLKIINEINSYIFLAKNNGEEKSIREFLREKNQISLNIITMIDEYEQRITLIKVVSSKEITPILRSTVIYRTIFTVIIILFIIFLMVKKFK